MSVSVSVQSGPAPTLTARVDDAEVWGWDWLPANVAIAATSTTPFEERLHVVHCVV
eukprot:m.2467 g.2467  ORF g.2467 m.2467 type:complete len:56 (+) comp1551_c1_seq1:118-285(+)